MSEKARYFVLGLLVALAMVFFVSANSGTGSGRYAIASSELGVFVLDTHTSAVVDLMEHARGFDHLWGRDEVRTIFQDANQ